MLRGFHVIPDPTSRPLTAADQANLLPLRNGGAFPSDMQGFCRVQDLAAAQGGALVTLPGTEGTLALPYGKGYSHGPSAGGGPDVTVIEPTGERLDTWNEAFYGGVAGAKFYGPEVMNFYRTRWIAKDPKTHYVPALGTRTMPAREAFQMNFVLPPARKFPFGTVQANDHHTFGTDIMCAYAADCGVVERLDPNDPSKTRPYPDGTIVVCDIEWYSQNHPINWTPSMPGSGGDRGAPKLKGLTAQQFMQRTASELWGGNTPEQFAAKILAMVE